ncbi:MAG: S-layer homology domain-containing protein [Bacillota bacterium]
MAFKLWGVALALMLLVPMQQRSALGGGNLFPDLPEHHPDQAAVLFLAERQMIQGYPDGTFRPEHALTRGAAIKLAVQVAGLAPSHTERPLPFADLPPDHWSRPYVRAGLAAGLVTGGDRFQPEQSLTRGELARLVLQAIRQPLHPLPDMALKDISPADPAYQAALLAVASGMMEAPDGLFEPYKTATRADAARAFAHALAFTAQAYDQPLTPVVEPLRGRVEMALPDSDHFDVVTAPTALPEGGRVRTSGASAAQLLFPDGSAFYLDNDSELVLIRSHGTALVSAEIVEDLEIELVRGRLFGAVVPMLDGEESLASVTTGAMAPARTALSARATPALQQALLASAEGEVSPPALPPSASRLLLFAGPASLEPGDEAGAELTIVLADDLGNPLVVEDEPVQLQLSSDVGTLSNPAPVIPVGYEAVTIQVYPPAAEPPDAKTRVTASAGEISTSLTIPTARIPWWKALFTKRVRAKVRMPWSVASIRGSYISAYVNGSENHVNVLAGSARLTSLTGEGVELGDTQATVVTGPARNPAAPGGLSETEQKQWGTQRAWATELAGRMSQSAPPQVLAMVTDEAGRIAGSLEQFPGDETPPSISITSPQSGLKVGTPVIRVKGTAQDDFKLVEVQVNGQSIGVGTGGVWSAQVQLAPGENVITATATDGGQNMASESITVSYDPNLLDLTLSGPGMTQAATAVVSGQVRSAHGITSLTVDGLAVSPSADGSFATTVSLAEGSNLIEAVATDAIGQTASASITILRATAPADLQLTLTEPADGLMTESATVTVSGSASAANGAIPTVSVNGNSVTLTDTGSFSASVPLEYGANLITVTASSGGGVASESRTVRRLLPLAITIDTPADGSSTDQEVVTVSGTVTGAHGTPLVTVNGQPAPVAADGTFSANVPLAQGSNEITAVVTDEAGRTVSHAVTVTLTVQQDASAEHTMIYAARAAVPPDGVSTTPISVRVRDSNGQQKTTGGDTVLLFTTLGTLGPVTDNGDGTYSATLTASTTEGEAVITGTLNGAEIQDIAKVNMHK